MVNKNKCIDLKDAVNIFNEAMRKNIYNFDLTRLEHFALYGYGYDNKGYSEYIKIEDTEGFGFWCELNDGSNGEVLISYTAEEFLGEIAYQDLHDEIHRAYMGDWQHTGIKVHKDKGYPVAEFIMNDGGKVLEVKIEPDYIERGLIGGYSFCASTDYKSDKLEYFMSISDAVEKFSVLINNYLKN